MSEPLVSIILPVYNGSRHLDEAVKSCLNQTYSRWELILVDDASTDDTLQRMQHYRDRDERIVLLRHKTNCKLPAALNTGFGSARGDLLSWTSDDNLYRPGALGEMVHFFKVHTEVDFVYADHTIIDEHGQALRVARVGRPAELGLANCIGPCFMYRRSVMEAIGSYRDDMFLVEDYDYWLRAAKVACFAPLHVDLYLRRVHGGSLTSRHADRIRQQTRAVLLANLNDMGRLRRAIRANGHMQLARLAHSCHDTTASHRHLRAAAVASPFRTICQLPSLASEGLFGTVIAGASTGLYRRLKRLRRHGIHRQHQSALQKAAVDRS